MITSQASKVSVKYTIVISPESRNSSKSVVPSRTILDNVEELYFFFSIIFKNPQSLFYEIYVARLSHIFEIRITLQSSWTPVALDYSETPV